MRKTKWQERVVMIGGLALATSGGLSGCGEEDSDDSGGGGSSGSQTYNSDAFPECWNRVWENCFDAAGACTLSGFNISWENGAAVNTSVAGTGSSSVYVSSSGETCATIEQTVDLATQSSVATITPGNGDPAFTYTADAEGSLVISCDGEDFTVDTGEASPDAMASGEGCEVDSDGFFGADGGFDLGSFFDSGVGTDDEDAGAGSDEDAGASSSEDAAAASGEKPADLSEACSIVYDYACDSGCADSNVNLGAQCEWASTDQEGLCCTWLPAVDSLADLCGWQPATVPSSCQ